MHKRARTLVVLATTAAALAGILATPASAAKAKVPTLGRTTMTVAPSAVAPTPTTTAAPKPALVPAYLETFSNPTWFTNWGRGSLPYRSTVATEGGNQFLRVSIPKGEHDGTSFFKRTGDFDAVTMRYRIRFGTGFDPARSAHNVKLPGFGNPVLGAGGVCLVACGGAAANGITGYSARSDVQDTGVPGSYVYDVSSPTPLPYGRGIRWDAKPFEPGRWHDVEVGIAMNTPGRANGVLRASIDGVEVFNRTDFKFRHVDSLHVGAAWFDFYYGGSGVAPTDITIDVDDIGLFIGI